MNTNIGISFPVVPVVIIIAAVIVVLFVLSCYRKAPPTEAIVVTGFGHKVPKVVSGKGVFVIPLLQRADSLNMRVIKLDVKTPATGVKTAEGVPVWIDSVVTTQVYSKTSTLTEKEKEEMGELTAEEYILQRQQAAISNFLGCGENEIDAKVNDILQGNLREIIAEMTVEEALTKRKEFASRVIDNARPDLAKMGLEVVTFNIQEIKDAEDSCGKSHGVIEAIGVEKEMEVKRKAETARANAKRDIEKSQAEAAQEANDARVNSDKAIAEKQNELAIRRAELKKDADKAAVEAEAVSQIQGQIQEKAIKERTVEAEIAEREKNIELAEKEAEVAEKRLDAEVRKAADAELYKRTKQAEAELFEQKKQAEAARYAKEQEAAGVLALAEAEAEAVRKKGLAEAEAMEKKAEAYKQYGHAAITEMIVKMLPDVAAQVAAPLSQIDRITIYGGDGGSGVNGVADNVPTVLAKTFDTVKAATGIDLAEIVRSESYDAKVNRNLNISGSLEGKTEMEPGMATACVDKAEAAAEAAATAEMAATAKAG